MGLPGKLVLLLVSLSICSAAADATGPRATTGSAQRGVYASLRAKWESTSVALEAAEFLVGPAARVRCLRWTALDNANCIGLPAASVDDCVLHALTPCGAAG